MKRREWTFEKQATELRDAASSRCQYHADRQEWWEGERDAANAAIQADGVQVRSHAVTGGERHEAVIDPTLVNRLGECERKIEQHRARCDEYAQWITALDGAAEQGRSFTLDYDDWMFFFGLRSDADE